MNKAIRLFLLPILSIILLLPAAIESANAGELTYVGSSTVGKYIHEASKVYTKSDFLIDTKSESGGGEKVGVNGGADLGGVARELNPCAISKGAMPTLIGRDAIAVIVNASNPVKNLTIVQLKGIFTGQIKNWKKVGGADAPIRALIVMEGSATRKVFKKVVLGGASYAGTEMITPDARIPLHVKKDPNAIGQISFAFLSSKNKKIRPLKIGGQDASVANPAYPITRPLYLVTKGFPKGEAKAFIDWTLSSAGQKLVMKNFVGVK